jgi:hypothetical protein
LTWYEVALQNFAVCIKPKSKIELKTFTSGCGMQSDDNQKRDEALPLGESMTSEAHPIASGVGG